MSLTAKTTKSFFWSGSSQILSQIVQLIVTVILAKLLSPSDFGILGMALVFMSFMSIINEMGITAAVVKERNINHAELSSIFFINLAVGFSLTVLTLCLAPLIARFYGIKELKSVIVLLSFNFFLGSFSVVNQALCQKNFEFKKIMIANLFSLIPSGVIGITLAYSGFGVKSLVFQMLSATFCKSIILVSLSSFRPKMTFNWKQVKGYFMFGLNAMGYNMVNYFARNLDYLLIGKFLGAEPLGYYTLAYKFMLYPLRNVSFVVGSVLSSAFSSIQGDKAKIRNAYLKGIQGISLITFPVMVGLFAVAPELIFVIFGPKWAPSVFIIRVLAFTGMVQSIGTTIGSVFLSSGRVDLQLKWSIFTVPLTCIALIIGLNWGIKGVAIAYTIIQLLLWLPSHAIPNWLIDLKMREFLLSLVPVSSASFIMLLAVLGFGYMQQGVLNLDEKALLISSIAVGASCYLLLLKLFKVKIVDELLSNLRITSLMKS